VNANILVRTMSLMFVFGFVTAQGARQGTALLAANAILINFQYFMAYALDGFAHSAEALVGRALGERNIAGLRKAFRYSLYWSAGVAILFTAAYLIAGTQMVALLTSQTELREVTVRYLPWIIVSPLFSFWSFLFDGVFIGATWAREMRNTMVISTFAVFIPVFYLFRGMGMGNDGLWLAFLVFMVARAVSMGWTYRHKEKLLLSSLTTS